MLNFDQVVEMIRRENEYGQGWAKGSRKVSQVEGVSDADVHAGTTGPAGQPFGISDWLGFARKYEREAWECMENFTPDGGAVRIRILKVVSLLVRCLMVYGQPIDVNRIAGKSSRDFPILGGGLKKFEESTTAEGCMIPTAETGKLRNEAPGCSPLRASVHPDDVEQPSNG